MSKTEPFSHREGEDAVWNGLVILECGTYGKNIKKKVEQMISCSKYSIFMTGLAVFWGF